MRTIFENLKENLFSRFQRVMDSEAEHLHQNSQQFFHFISTEPGVKEIFETLHENTFRIKDQMNPLLSGQKPIFKSLYESALVGVKVLESCPFSWKDAENAFSVASTGETDRAKSVAYFKRNLIEPVFLIINEKISERQCFLHFLIRYKQKAEWFKKDELFEIAKKITSQTEINLQKHLFEYLHDCEVVFFVEPRSPGGKVDFLSPQKDGSRVIAETKVFSRGSRGKSYLIKGFRQLYNYTCDHNEPFGFLIIYNISDAAIHFSFKNSTFGVPRIHFNDKIIHFLNIDLHPYSVSASQRGKAKVVKISESELIKVV